MKVKRKHWLNDSVIAVDHSFMPMMEIPRRHAIKALITERAEAVFMLDWTRRAWFELDNFRDFEVIIYPHVTAVKESKITIGRGFRGVLERDGHACQYCNGKAMTIDHVMPKSRGGSNSPSNLVACCQKCNSKKGDRTPDEAGMPLLHPIRNFRWNLIEKFHKLAEKR
jgi:hypothetical protein